MKTEVLEIVNCECPETDKFNKLFAVYQKLPGKSNAQERRFNAQGYSQKNYESLEYECKKLVGLSDLEVAVGEKSPCSNCGKSGAEKPTPTEKKADSKKEAPVVEQTPKIRDEYSFLNQKDCPEEFKILVADKITAFKTIQSGQEKLHAAKNGESDLSEEELAEIAQEVAASDELNIAITEELDHYQKTGEILGNHPIFKERNLKKAIDKMTGEEKAKRINALETGIRRDKSSLKKAKSEADAEKISSRMEAKELELKLVKLSM